VFAKHCRENLYSKQNVCIAFEGLLKAFDNVNWKVMMKVLKMVKVDYRDKRIVRELYKHHTTSTKIKES
jgi:hypothetical protein